MIAAINSSKFKNAFTIKLGNTSNRSVGNIKILLHKTCTCILAHHPLEGTVSSEETSVIFCCSWAVEIEVTIGEREKQLICIIILHDITSIESTKQTLKIISIYHTSVYIDTKA